MLRSFRLLFLNHRRIMLLQIPRYGQMSALRPSNHRLQYLFVPGLLPQEIHYIYRLLRMTRYRLPVRSSCPASSSSALPCCEAGWFCLLYLLSSFRSVRYLSFRLSFYKFLHFLRSLNFSHRLLLHLCHRIFLSLPLYSLFLQLLCSHKLLLYTPLLLHC